jgi:hypothetical protein
MLFEAMVTFSIALLLYQGAPVNKSHSAAVLRHLKNTMESLRRQLLEASYADDAIILTILLIALTNLFIKDLYTFNIHIDAANGLVTKRGGPVSLGMDGYVRERLAQINLLRAGLPPAPVTGSRHNCRTPDGKNIHLKYPDLSSLADLKDKDSCLPPGLHKLASAQEFSRQFIDLLIDWFPSLHRNHYIPPNVFLRSRANFRPTEHLIAVALVACSLFFCPESGYRALLMQGNLNYQVRLLTADQVACCDTDAVLWAKFMLRATTPPELEPWS